MNVNFGSLQKDDYNRKNIDFCMKYAESFNKMQKDGKGLLMWGNVGTGKSYSAAAIANRVHELGYSVVTASLTEITTDLGDTNSDNKTIHELECADLIILDDFKPNLCTEHTLEKLYKIIDFRYQKNLPIIVTTNMTPREMDETAGASSQIFDRLLECCYLVQFTGPNRYNTAEYNSSVSELARQFLDMTVPREKLREICRDYNIEADEGASYGDLLRIAVLKRAEEGDKEAAELVREFHLHEKNKTNRSGNI